MITEQRDFKSNTYIGHDGKIHRYYSRANIVPALVLTTAIGMFLALILFLFVK